MKRMLESTRASIKSRFSSPGRPKANRTPCRSRQRTNSSAEVILSPRESQPDHLRSFDCSTTTLLLFTSKGGLLVLGLTPVVRTRPACDTFDGIGCCGRCRQTESESSGPIMKITRAIKKEAMRSCIEKATPTQTARLGRVARYQPGQDLVMGSWVL